MTSSKLKDFYKYEVLDYQIELHPIMNFKEFYDNCNSFNDISEKAFLNAVKIPSTYFMKQPEDTKNELLENQKDIIPAKLRSKFIVILKKGDIVLNCARVDRNDFENLQERISISEENYKKLTFIKDFVKEGYSSCFVSLNTLVQGYNLGLFIDVPLMANKTPAVNIGLYYVPKVGEDVRKNLYLKDSGVNFEDYQSLDMLIEDIENIVKDIDTGKIITELKDKLLLRELDEVLINLVKEKVIPKSYKKKISRYGDFNEVNVSTVYSLVELILVYELNFISYKQVNSVRNCLVKILKIISKLERTD